MNVQPIRRIEDLKRNRRLRKGMFVLPSLFTALNMAAGYFAINQCILAVMDGNYIHYDYAAKAIGFAVLFDGLDGRIARMTNSTSEFGKQLDSLADVITFGLAPAILAFLWGVRQTSSPFDNPEWQTRFVQFGAIVSFLFLAASASRLARFNIQTDPKPMNPGRPGRKYFVGMPTPAGAGVIAAVVHLVSGAPLVTWWMSAAWIALIFVLGYMEVSAWRFYSFKDIDLKKQKPFTTFILVTGLISAIWFFSHMVLFAIAMAYMLSGLMARISYSLRRSRLPAEDPQPDPTP